MDAANLLRAYNTALHEAVTTERVINISRRWRRDNAFGDHTAATTAIRAAHLERVAGRGSPALCDEALQTAIREIGNG